MALEFGAGLVLGNRMKEGGELNLSDRAGSKSCTYHLLSDSPGQSMGPWTHRVHKSLRMLPCSWIL